MYQSLHTTVIGPGRERIEIQIRTHEMHRVAEHGIAAHWKYKESTPAASIPKDAEQFGWLRQLMEFQKELKDPAEFLESVKVDLFQDEVYVFTPKGDVRVFPRGATPIDFAYAIHSEVGEHCTGARVNGADRAAPLQAAQRRRGRDHDHARTSSRARTGSTSWSRTRARTRIRGYLRAEQREKSSSSGASCSSARCTSAGMSLSKFVQERAEAASA